MWRKENANFQTSKSDILMFNNSSLYILYTSPGVNKSYNLVERDLGIWRIHELVKHHNLTENCFKAALAY